MSRFDRIPPVLQIAIGIGCVLGLILAAQVLVSAGDQARIPAGWQLVRPPGEVSALVMDGAVVYAGGRDGLFIVDRASGRVLPLPPGLPQLGSVRGLALDRAGGLWVAADNGLGVLRGERWTDMTPSDGTPTRFRAVVEDGNRVVWASGEGGLIRLTNGTWSSVTPPGGWTVSPDILLASSDGALWVGSSSPAGGALFRFDSANWTTVSVADGLPHPVVNALCESRNGTVYVATGFANRGGLGIFRDGAWSNMSVRDGLAGPNVRSVFEDSAGRFWIGSEYDGLAILGPRGKCPLTRADGLIADEVKAVAEDPAGGFWLGTAGGLMRVTEPCPG